MLLNKNNLRIVKFVDETRIGLQNLHVTPDYTEACDGHTLVRVSINKDLKDKDFPSISPFSLSDNQSTEVLLDSKAVRESLDNLPKKTTRPILLNALLDAPKSGGRSFLYTTDTDATQANISRNPNVKYPGTDKVIPKGDPVLHARFNAQKLIALLEVLKECADYDSFFRVDLLFYPWQKEHQIVVKAKTDTGQEFLGTIMPMRMEDEERQDKTPEE